MNLNRRQALQALAALPMLAATPVPLQARVALRIHDSEVFDLGALPPGVFYDEAWWWYMQGVRHRLALQGVDARQPS